MHTFPKISIIIPVYNGAGTLSSCLDSVMALDYPKECLETIVIDNNSTDSTKEIIRQYPVKYVFEEIRSPARARNKGIENSSGEFIAFIDADCVATGNWINSLILQMKNANTGGIGGRIESFTPQTWVEKYIVSKKFYTQWGQKPRLNYFLPWIFTSNALFRRDALEKVGLFDSRFTLAASEDIDITTRVALAGYHIIYAHKAVVLHKHRSNLKNFCAWRYKWGRSVPQLLFKYRNITGVNLRNCITVEALKTIAFIREGTLKLFKNIFKLESKQNIIFSFLGLIGDINCFFGYFYGWLEVLFGLKKIPALKINDKDGILFWNVGNALEIIDLSKKTTTYYYANKTGRRIFKLLVLHDRSPEEIINIFKQEYQDCPQELREDIYGFIDRLKKENILKRTSSFSSDFQEGFRSKKLAVSIPEVF